MQLRRKSKLLIAGTVLAFATPPTTLAQDWGVTFLELKLGMSVKAVSEWKRGLPKDRSNQVYFLCGTQIDRMMAPPIGWAGFLPNLPEHVDRNSPPNADIGSEVGTIACAFYRLRAMLTWDEHSIPFAGNLAFPKFYFLQKDGALTLFRIVFRIAPDHVAFVRQAYTEKYGEPSAGTDAYPFNSQNADTFSERYDQLCSWKIGAELLAMRKNKRAQGVVTIVDLQAQDQLSKRQQEKIERDAEAKKRKTDEDKARALKDL
jgi:hypothetical protein